MAELYLRRAEELQGSSEPGEWLVDKQTTRKKDAEPFVGDQFCLINGVRVPQSLYHSSTEKARGSNVRFPPIADIRGLGLR